MKLNDFHLQTMNDSKLKRLFGSLSDLMRTSPNSLEDKGADRNPSSSRPMIPEETPEFVIPRRTMRKYTLSANEEIMHYLRTTKGEDFIDFIMFEVKHGNNSVSRLNELCEVWQD